MINSLLVKVGHVDGTVWPHLNVDRAKPRVSAGQRVTDILGAVGGTISFDFGHDHATLQRFHPVKSTGKRRLEKSAFLDHKRVRESRNTVVLHPWEITKGIRIG